MTIRALEFYSGIGTSAIHRECTQKTNFAYTIFIKKTDIYLSLGGLHRAFIQSNVQGQVVHAFDWDQSACRVYDANYGEGIVQKVPHHPA